MFVDVDVFRFKMMKSVFDCGVVFLKFVYDV